MIVILRALLPNMIKHSQAIIGEGRLCNFIRTFERRYIDKFLSSLLMYTSTRITLFL